MSYDGWSLTLRGEFGEYEDSDWTRVEIESKAVTLEELQDVLQRYVEAIGFNYVNVSLENKES